MAYASQPRGGSTFNSRSLKLDFAPEDDDWRHDPEPARDLKKYILMFGLGSLSWVATYIGMLELIQANLGALPFTHKVVIGFSVAMLMVMIIWLLDQLFKSHPPTVKLAYVAGYLFLTLISVGFGFGFYWKVLESRTEASRSAESAVGQVQSSLNGASIRLEQLQATLTQLADVSQKKSELERTKGTSCPNSRPGDGPRRKMRAADAAKFSFASEFVAGRVGAIKQDMKALDGDLVKIAKKDPSIVDAKSGTRNEFMRALGRKLDLTVAGFNAFRTDPQLKQLRSDLAARSEKTIFQVAGGKSFTCPDPQLQQALRGAVRALDQLPVLDKPKIAVVEGSEATIEAFRRLTATLQGALTFKLPPSADELRALQQKAIRQAVSKSDQAKLSHETAGLSSRDYVPLAIALFVDLCLLLVSMGRATNRIENLVPKMRAAERGPVIEILSRFKDIHRDPQVRDNFEVFRHVVFDQNGDYYVAVPLDAPYAGLPNGRYGGQYGTEQAQELQHEAHLLANLFTSFEKERIFRRVYNPLLLNTRAIQKRLARQGSKFAGCEAFRVYKFRDGAWSEIILGAVMGAARRAETKRRRSELERELFTSTAPPTADTGFVQPQTREPTFSGAFAPSATERTQTAAFDFASQPTGDNQSAPPSHIDAAASDELHAAAWSEEIGSTGAISSDRGSVTAEHEAKYGPYAVHVSDDESDDNEDGPSTGTAHATEADVTVTTGDVMPVPKPEQDMIAPEPGHMPAVKPESQVDVVLTRDTATISVPVTEATLPNGVADMMRNALAAANAELNGHPVEDQQLQQLDAEPASQVAAPEAVIALPYVPEDAEIHKPDPMVEERDGEDLSRLASRFAARADV